MRTGALALIAVLLALPEEKTLLYRFLTVKSTVIVRHAGVERRATAGDAGNAGDEVRTGFWGRAILEESTHHVRFEVLPSTRVRLGGATPGVLLVIERGRLKAVFDAVVEPMERLVETPGALLAVRGTRYAVEVARDGTAALAVFAGTVEVQPRDARFPLTPVRAGELCRFGRDVPPHRTPLPPGVSEERWRGGLAARDAGKSGDGGRGSEGERRPGTAPRNRPPSGGKHGGGTS